jgi:histidinol-phosphate aminotransferase
MDGEYIGVPNKDFGFDLDACLKAINEKTKLIYIANPNNPTGTRFNQKAQETFMKQLSKDILVVFDEAYNEYIDDPDFPDTLSMLQEYDNIILLRTFSKMYGLASLRIGYGIGSAKVIDSINRIRNPFNVTTAAQAAAVAALKDEHFVKESFELNAAAREYTYERCDKMGLSYIPSNTNFVFIDCKKPADELFIKFQEKGIIVRPIPHPDTMTFLRISLGTIKQMEKTFNVLKEILTS